jgi:hypothetical protein
VLFSMAAVMAAAAVVGLVGLRRGRQEDLDAEGAAPAVANGPAISE